MPRTSSGQQTHQRHRAEDFQARHRAAADGGPPVVLPTAWDAASAAVMVDAGATALGTTSGGMSWSLGHPDGERLDRADALAAVGRVVAAVDVPVTADLEAGYATDPAGVADTVSSALATGAVGLNLEDGLRPVAEATARVVAARQAIDTAQVHAFLNARIDAVLAVVARDPAADVAPLLDDVVTRARAYVDAGADGVFVPGLVDPALLARLRDQVHAPLSVMAVPGGPSVDQLHSAGAARVSLGTWVAQAAYSVARRVSSELLTSGTYEALGTSESYHGLNALLAREPALLAREPDGA